MSFKKKKQEPPVVDYTKWHDDLGFLNLILSRKKNITKEFVIGVYQQQKTSQQKTTPQYLTDEEIEPIVTNIVIEAIEQIGDKYKDFLVDKYFGSLDNLIKYISEDVYIDLTSDAINRNSRKIAATIQRNAIASLSNLNKNNK